MGRLLRIGIALLAVTAACSGQVPEVGSGETIQPVVTTSGGSDGAAADSTTTTIVPEPLVIPPSLGGWETRSLSIVDGELTYFLTVAVADTSEKRAQGLMNVPDLGDLDGMLFLWDAPTTATFWMENTILALDIAFFGNDMVLVDHFSMEPCVVETCPKFEAAGAFRYAIEVPNTGFVALTPAARLVLEG